MPKQYSSVTGMVQYIPDADILTDTGFQFPVVANTVFCQLTLPAGHWRIDVTRLAYGTGSPQIANNSHFFVGGTNHTLTTGGILGVLYSYQYFLTLNGSTTIGVRSIGNGSANIGVTAGITAIRLP